VQQHRREQVQEITSRSSERSRTLPAHATTNLSGGVASETAGPFLRGKGPASSVKEERGQTMVELALTLPILIGLMLGIVQFGIAFNNYVALTDAVRAGARKAAVSRSASDPAGECRAQVIASAGSLDTGELGRNLSCTSSWAPGAEVRVYADYPVEIKLLDWAIYSGRLTSEMKERVE
jgi:Flp pilus assembly protein TadG